MESDLLSTPTREPSKGKESRSHVFLKTRLFVQHSNCNCGISDTHAIIKRIFIGFLLGVIREGNGTSLQYSCMENPMDGGAW